MLGCTLPEDWNDQVSDQPLNIAEGALLPHLAGGLVQPGHGGAVERCGQAGRLQIVAYGTGG